MEKRLSPVRRLARRVSRPWRYLRDLSPATHSRHVNRLRIQPEYQVHVRGIYTPIWLRANQPDYRILRYTVGRREVDIALIALVNLGGTRRAQV